MKRLLLCVMFLACSKDERPAYPKATPPTSGVAQSSPASVTASMTKAVVVKPALEPAQYVSAMESVGGIFQTGKDCAALSREMSEALAANREAIMGSTPELMQALNADEALRLRLRAAMSSVMDISMRCQGDAAFQAMISSISPN